MLTPTESLLSPTDFAHIDTTPTLRDHFYLLENNLEGTEIIEDAEVFFLGNSSHRKTQAWIISALIQKLYREGDIVLSESLYADRSSCPNTQFVISPITIQEWDPKRRETELQDKESLINILLHIDHVRTNGLSPTDWVEDIHELIGLFPSTENHHIMIHDTYSRKKLAILTSPQARLHCFNQLVVSISTAWERHLKALCDPYAGNTHIVHTIEQHIPQSSRIFVIANIANLTLNPLFNRVAGYEKAAQLLFKYCSDKKYVVLYPNENNVDLIAIQKELQRPSICNRITHTFKRLPKKHKCRIGVAAVITSPALCLIATTAALVWGSYKALSCCGNALCCLKRNRYRDSLEQQNLFFLMTMIILSAKDETFLPRQRGMTLVESTHASLPTLPHASKKEESQQLSRVSFSLGGREIISPLSPSSSEGSDSPKSVRCAHTYHTFT